METSEKKARLVFTSRLTPKANPEQAQSTDEKLDRPGLPVSSEVLFRTTISNVGGRTNTSPW